MHPKSISKFNLGRLALVILFIAIVLLVYLIYDLRDTERNLAESLIDKNLTNAELELGRYFSKAENMIEVSGSQAILSNINDLSSEKMRNHFAPILKYNPHVRYSAFISEDIGEMDFHWEDTLFISQEVWITEKGSNDKLIKSWYLDSASMEWDLVDQVKTEDTLKMRETEMYDRFIKSANRKPSWYGPTWIRGARTLGMTVATAYTSVDEGESWAIAYAIVLTQISDYTQRMRPSNNGGVFILSSDGRYIGLPYSEVYSSPDWVQQHLFTHIDSCGLDIHSAAYRYWLSNMNQDKSAFKFSTGRESWWSDFSRYQLSDDLYMIIGLVVPESDILSELNRTKRIIIGSFIFILLLTSFLLYSYNQTRKAKIVVEVKNEEISKQNTLIEKKNNDILDSISYASRLQSVMLPARDAISAFFKDYFILYKPKDIVAGDFYWMKQHRNTVLLAAADCTGHGVPGAIVSMVAISALDRVVRDFDLTDPGEILDTTRQIIISEFGRTDTKVSDGMDIAMVAIRDSQIWYAGANNPLWMIRNDDLIEYKATRQPVGLYDKNEKYTSHKIDILPGDSFYLFSDGIVDQFGGDSGRKLKAVNFKKILLDICGESMEKQGQLIEKTFEDWKGNYSQIDDICVIGFRL